MCAPAYPVHCIVSLLLLTFSGKIFDIESVKGIREQRALKCTHFYNYR